MPDEGYSKLVLNLLQQSSPVRNVSFSSKLQTRSTSRSREKAPDSLSPLRHDNGGGPPSPPLSQKGSILARIEALTEPLSKPEEPNIEATRSFIASTKHLDRKKLTEMEDFMSQVPVPKILALSHMALSPSPKAA